MSTSVSSVLTETELNQMIEYLVEGNDPRDIAMLYISNLSDHRVEALKAEVKKFNEYVAEQQDGNKK